jgi:hypothetical protein
MWNTIKAWFTIGKSIVVVAVLLLLASSIYGWFFKPKEVVEVWQQVPVIEVVEKIKTVKVPGPKEVVTIEKQVVVEKLKLPDWVKTDENKQVIATAEIKPYKGQTDVVALLDTKTGESQILAEQRKLSLFALENTKEVGVRYGISSEYGTVTDIYGRITVLRVGPTHLGIYGEVSHKSEGKSDAKAQIDLRYEW